MQHATLGTVQTVHHYAAGLTDEQAARLEGHARRFYTRALILQSQTGCSIQMAIQAIQDAMKEEANG